MPSQFASRSACLAFLSLLAGSANAEPERAVNSFACSLYARLVEQDENLFISPFSIGTALAMAAEGARGETAQQMGTVLALPATAQRDDAHRPWDWSALHTPLAQLAGRIAPRPPSPASIEKIASLRAKLEKANARIASATSYDRAHEELGARAAALADEINVLQADIDPTEFRSANALWVERSFPIEAPYLEAIARDYDSGGAMPLDFRAAPERGRVTINQWVARQTKGRITDLLAPGMVDDTTRLVLTNAVYFLGEWLEPFDRARTRDEAFHLGDGSRIDVSLMRARKSEAVRYAAFEADGSPFATPRHVTLGDSDVSGRYPTRGFQIVELPYRGDRLVMQVILPTGIDALAPVEAMLSAENLERWNAALEARSVDVALPRFRMDTAFELSAPLRELGMPRAFANPADADVGAQFEGISAGRDPSQRLYIGAVVHKAFVQVDEKGTEAAAATAVSLMAGAAMPTMVDFIPVFRADRPFVFLIREKASGTVLFLGRLVRPPSR
jgi:serine protease inhibitor